MPDLNMPTNTVKVPPDMIAILGNLVAQNVSGPMKDYAQARMNGDVIAPELAKAAFTQASSLVNAADAAGHTDVSLGGAKSISVDILSALLNDISMYAKVAASRQSINKLADKFEKLIK